VSTFRRKYRQVQTRRPEDSLPSREDKNVSTDDDHLKLTRINDDEGSVVPGDGHVSSSTGEDNVDHAVTQQKTFKRLTEKVAKFAQFASPNQNSKSQEGELKVEELTPFIPKSQKANLFIGITSLTHQQRKIRSVESYERNRE
jgi:hypothetical protein